LKFSLAHFEPTEIEVHASVVRFKGLQKPKTMKGRLKTPEHEIAKRGLEMPLKLSGPAAIDSLQNFRGLFGPLRALIKSQDIVSGRQRNLRSVSLHAAFSLGRR
jgi:hypothetical protein